MNAPNYSTDLSHWSGNDWDEIGFNDFESEGIHTTKPTVYRHIAQGKFPPPIGPNKWFRGQLRDHKRRKALDALSKQAVLRKQQFV